MSQCVPSWDLKDNPSTVAKNSQRAASPANRVPTFGYEVAELTWENGQLACHGLGASRSHSKPSNKYIWEKPSASGTLESIVNQATCLPIPKPNPPIISTEPNCKDLVPWSEDSKSTSATMTMDALVPCSNPTAQQAICSTTVASCSVATTRATAVDVHGASEWSRDQSVSNSGTFEKDSQQLTLDTCDMITSTSMGSPENTSSGKDCTKGTTTDEKDYVCHSRPEAYFRETNRKEKKKGNEKCSISTRRSRAAAIHNQSERKRRDKINQRMKILQKLVPNSSKTDKASMLDEVINYVKQLQAHVQIMSRMNLPSLMLPLALQQQQLQMSMLGQMGIGMGPMAMGGHNIAGLSPLFHPHHSAFMPMPSWDGSSAHRHQAQATTPTVVPDPLSTFMACQSQQPMTMDAFSRMAAMYQQFHQHQVSGSKD